MITLIKILTWLASPMGILTASSLSAATLLALRKAPRLRLLLITFGLAQLIFFATPWTTAQLSQGLENKTKSLQTQNQGGPYTAILLLGGGITPAAPDNQTPANANEAFDRVIYAAQLYHKGIAPRIIASGGTGLRDAYPQAQTEAQAMKDALIQMGVPNDTIILENQSLTTRQNMAFTAELVDSNNIHGRLALVSSVSHTPRARQNALAAGLLIDVYPSDWPTPITYKPLHLRWLPNAQSLMESEGALKEWLALFLSY